MYKVENVWKDWRVTRLIGEGSSGKVYEIVRDNMGIEEHSALKVITIPKSQTEVRLFRNEGMDDKSVTEYFRSIVEDFIHEISIMSKLKGNPNVVAYEDYQVVEHENELGWDILIRMELLTPLPDVIGKQQLNEDEVIELGIEMCEALSVCHKNKIIHRDIKYDNIFISDGGVYKLGDFGVARTIEKTSGNFSVKGTYTYMAPEVYKGEPYGIGADIYSLGMVLYRLLNCNREPFLPLPPDTIKLADRDNALVERMQGKALNPPANADEHLSQIILKACAFKSEDRFSSAYEFKSELKKCRYDKIHSDSMNDSIDKADKKTENTYESDNYKEDKTVSVNNTAEKSVENIDNGSNNHAKSKKILVAVCAVAAIAVAAIIVVFVMFNNSSKINTGGKSNNEYINSVSVNSFTEKVTSSDTTTSEKSDEEISYEKGLKYLSDYAVDNDDQLLQKAIEQFEKAGDYEKASDYLKIANGCLSSNVNATVQVLKNYADDIYVQEIIMSNKYIYDFFCDSVWSGDPDKGTDATLFISFDRYCETDYNLPSYGYDEEEKNKEISYYSFYNGDYSIYFDDETNEDNGLVLWKFFVSGKNTVEVYCYETTETLYLKRN